MNTQMKRDRLVDIVEILRNDHSEFDNDDSVEIIGDNPFHLFHQWYTEAFDKKQPEPNAFSLSTVDSEGAPSSRIVYLKELLEEKFIFYTNYKSQKGKNLEVNPKAAMLFFWPGLEKQIRIEGYCEKVDPEISDDYFNSRPESSKLGAWASQQSEILNDRSELEDRLREYSEEFNAHIPRPPHWGGYQLIPQRIEFWKGRPSRLHDRIVWELIHNTWTFYRKNP
jgi:pyridoxamine 5'-phosphate oxidase